MRHGATADALVEARRSAQPVAAVPLPDAEAAYAVQDGVARALRWFDDAGPLAPGSPASRRPRCSERTRRCPPAGSGRSPAGAGHWPFPLRGIEAEIALRLAQDVAGDTGRAPRRRAGRSAGRRDVRVDRDRRLALDRGHARTAARQAGRPAVARRAGAGRLGAVCAARLERRSSAGCASASTRPSSTAAAMRWAIRPGCWLPGCAMPPAAAAPCPRAPWSPPAPGSASSTPRPATGCPPSSRASAPPGCSCSSGRGAHSSNFEMSDDHAEQAPQRPPLPGDPRPQPGARPHPARHEPAHHRPPRARVRRCWAGRSSPACSRSSRPGIRWRSTRPRALAPGRPRWPTR